jgi:hypothetical protein
VTRPESRGRVPQPGVTYSFRRPVSRVIVDLVGLPLGALLFLGGAWLMLTGAIVADDPIAAILTRFVAPLFFGFFGLLMASGIPASLRRGARRTVLKIGPEGMWTPEMGTLNWNEIADVRLEAIPGFSGRHAGEDPPQSPTIYRRLGIFPRDAGRSAAVRRGLTWRMLGWMQDVTRAVSPRARMKNIEDMAPYGVFAYEIDRPLEDAVAVIQHYREVTIEPVPSPDPSPEPGGIRLGD